ncbi:hypothetical protein MNF30_04145 [Mycoplasma mycoides subsp. capri]|uniref:hypothetical protein n=1 Tax=Mycoplasma mycoides TaxID=2102 RepID=UPI002240D9C3|nr:hypothetical protein [Mycoplasma mycoides]UZK64129.1 hypothetical protein MNF30_04145 [Mycoplasma mycoides subsp. capri]
MKKSLSLLSILALTGTTSLAVLACKKTDSFDITVQTNDKWLPAYQRAIDKLNNEYKQRGLKFKFVIKKIDQLDHIGNIEAKGIRDKNIADIFAIPFDNYQKAIRGNWISNLTKEIQNVLIKNEEDSKRFGIKKTDKGIEVESNKEVWSNSSHQTDKGFEYGMVPFSVENLVWMFDKKELGIEVKDKQAYLVGEKIKDVNDLEKIKIKNNDKEEEVPAATIENLIKINKKNNNPIAFLPPQNGYLAGTVLNAYVNKNEEKIKSKKAEWSTVGLIWANKDTKLNSKEYAKFSSLMEDTDLKDDFEYATNQLQELGKSYGDSVFKTMIGKEKDDEFNTKIVQLELDGIVKLKLAGPWEVKDTIARMNNGNRNVDFGFVSVGSVSIGKSNDKNKLAGFAGGFGLVAKQTISNQISEDKEGKKVTKLEAAVEFMKEITKAEYNKDIAFDDGKISSYKSVVEAVEKEIEKEGNSTKKLVAKSHKLVLESFLTSGKDKEFTAKPNTELFGEYWGPFTTAYRLSMKDGKFGELFKQQYEKAKQKLIKGN